MGIDYHIDVEGHYYSVPYQLIKQQLDIRITHDTVECFHKGKRVAAHIRTAGRGHSAIPEHMPTAHQSYAQWTPERIIRWSRSIGEQTAVAANIIISRRHHPQQGFRACLGLMSMGKKYSNEWLEAACHRAIITNCVSYKSIKSILKTGLDRDSPCWRCKQHSKHLTTATSVVLNTSIKHKENKQCLHTRYKIN